MLGATKKIATRDIPEYATVIECIDEIQQGDVFAKIGSHVMFFVEFISDEKKEVVGNFQFVENLKLSVIRLVETER